MISKFDTLLDAPGSGLSGAFQINAVECRHMFFDKTKNALEPVVKKTNLQN